MEPKGHRHRCTEMQLNYLVDYMSQHQKFATGKFTGVLGKKSQGEMWVKLSIILNELGPQKSLDQWKKVWKNQKLLTRKKRSEIKINLQKTGNLVTSENYMSEREMKILATIGNDSSLGLGFGKGSSNLVELDNIELITEENEQESLIIEIENTNDVLSDTEQHSESAELPIEEQNKERKENKDPNHYNFAKIKQSEEKILFDQLIKSNNEGLNAVAGALENVAQAANNIACSLTYLGDIAKTYLLK